MPTEEQFDVVFSAEPQSGPAETQPVEHVPIEEALQMPRVDEQEAIRVAMKYRLDLLNNFDRINDAERGINVAENNMLPSLNAKGSVQMDTDPNHLSTLGYNSERTTWRGSVDLELPLDRKAERNALRSSLINKRRAERNYQQAKDLVTLQVRRAMRRVEQERASLQIQIHNRDLAIERRKIAQVFFQKGRVSNREVFDAEDELLDARNRLAQAQAGNRSAILEFRRDTGTLRVDDEGKWSGTVAESTEKH
jgi:outer membrane protein TolC